MKTSRLDLGFLLDREARRMVAYAHEPEHFLRPERGESPERDHPAHLVYRMKLPNWETMVKFAYSVDVRDGRGVRHLSISISVPGHHTQGEMTQGAGPLLEVFDSSVRLFFPMVEGIRYQITALAPVPIVDARQERRDRNVHYRTPVIFHFLADHGVVDEIEAAAPPKMRALAFRLALGALGQLTRDAKSHDFGDLVQTAEQRTELVEELHALARETYRQSRADATGTSDLVRALEKFVAKCSEDTETFHETVVVVARGDFDDLIAAVEAARPPPVDLSPDEMAN